MSASTQAAPKQISFGRFPTVLAALALVVILAAMIAIVALNGTKAAAPAVSGAQGEPPPIGYDHGSSIDWGQSVTNVPFYDHGWSSATTYKLPTYEGSFVNQDDPGPAIVVTVPHGEYPAPGTPENTGSRPRNQ